MVSFEPMSPERLQPERRETAEQTIQRFISFTKRPFETEIASRFDSVATEWEYHMNTLYGHEELMRVNKDENLRGVRYIEEKLEHALVQGGISALKIEFLKQALSHTKVEKMGENALPAIKRIINFK
jgi:hypothetical protein